MNRFVLLFIFCLAGSSFFATGQRMNKKNDTPKVVVHKKPITRKNNKPLPLINDLTIGLNINSNGWGLQVQRLRFTEESESNIWKGIYVEATQIHHAKESKLLSKISNPNPQDGPKNLRYTYGKTNALFPIKIGYMFKKEISGKLEKNHIQLHVTGGAGLEAGLLKPYYLQLAKSSGGVFSTIDAKYGDANSENFLNQRYIVGYSGFTKGWNELQVIPGLHIMSGLQFEYGANKKSGLIVELGASTDIFTQRVPLIAITNNQFAFANLFISLKKIWRYS